ncbi:MAG TPA: LamG-like jellyroll fold domain-containing protein [Nitrososphaeraceae archaeon]
MRNFNFNLTFLAVVVTFSVLSIIAILNSQPIYSQNSTNPEVSYLDVNNTGSVSKFSVAAWFKTSNDYNSNAFIVNKAGDSGNMNYGIWMNSAEKIQAGFETSTGNPMYATSPLSYSDGKWHYAVVTYDGSVINLYVDGLMVATKSSSGSPDSGGDEPVRLGADSQSFNNYFIGEVDEVRVWNGALTAQQVIDAYNGNFDTKNQILYLDFSQPLNETLAVNQTSLNATSALNQTTTNATSATNETAATNATSATNETAATNATGLLGNNQTLPSSITKPQTKNETGITNETGLTNETQIENQTSESKLVEKNNIPKAFDQSVSLDQNSRIDITLVADDEDKDKLQFDITADPSHGSLDNFNKEKGTVTYTPEKDYSGDDKFSFRAIDPNGGQSDSANVNIKINAAAQMNETQNTERGATRTENLINETSSKQTAETNTIQETNIPPKADAGDNQKAEVNTEVKLDGGKSSDDDGKIVSYKWEQTDGPKADLKKSDENIASFTVPDSAAGSKLSFKLTVVDDKDASSSDDVTVQVENAAENTAQQTNTNAQNETNQKSETNQQTATVDQTKENIPPKADAGDNQKAEVNTEVKLDGGKSSDDDGKIVSYKWEQTDGPKVDLKKSDEKVASFTVPDSAAGSKLSFKLKVVDDKDASNSDDVTVEVEKIAQG